LESTPHAGVGHGAEVGVADDAAFRATLLCAIHVVMRASPRPADRVVRASQH
jgi:hypothetical protein